MSRIVIVGEAWGKDEEAAQAPFVGASGRMLRGLLAQAGIPLSDCYLTNVFNLRPKPTNDVKNLCGPKAEGIPRMPALQQGKYVHARYEPELERLYEEIRIERPNLIIAFGATGAWALLRTSGIRDLRGTPALSARTGFKVLPTYHPAAVLRDYSLRPVVFADLQKARREAEFPEVRRPSREIWVEPSLEDLDFFAETYILPNPALSIDIETKGDMITCVGFAPTTAHAIVVPFFDPTRPGKNYWPSFAEEKAAWLWIKCMCALPKRMLFQNGLYDMHILWRVMGITVPHAADDTMLMHHAQFPELQKGLGFLGSIYTDEASWKVMRRGAGMETLKKED